MRSSALPQISYMLRAICVQQHCLRCWSPAGVHAMQIVMNCSTHVQRGLSLIGSPSDRCGGFC